MHILVVDDNDMNRLLAAEMLRERGWTAELAAGGLEAMVKLDHDEFDAVLLDVGMPHLGGDELCRWIRADERLAGLPVVAYTAHVLPDEVRRYREHGFDAVLSKPATCEQVWNALERGRGEPR